MSLFRRKSLAELMPVDDGTGLKRTLTASNLVLLGAGGVTLSLEAARPATLHATARSRAALGPTLPSVYRPPRTAFVAAFS